MVRMFALMNARITIREKGINIIKFIDVKIACIAMALQKMDKINHEESKKISEYSIDAHHEKYIPILEQINFMISNHGKKIFDFNISSKEKIQYLLNSIELFEKLFEDMYNQKEYHQLKDKYHLTIETLKNKINDNDLRSDILKRMEKAKINFLLSMDNNFIVYPILTDLLRDIHELEYAESLDKELIQQIHVKYKLVGDAQNNRKIFAGSFYSKVDFLYQVKFANVRQYIIKEYSRILECPKFNKQVQPFT